METTWKKQKVSRFKEILERELDTFINPDEFAEEAIINGVSINVVIGSLSSKNPRSKYRENDFYERNHDKNLTTLTTKKSDYALLDGVERGEYIVVNDKSFKVEKIIESTGIIKLELQAYGSENYSS